MSLAERGQHGVVVNVILFFCGAIKKWSHPPDMDGGGVAVGMPARGGSVAH
jgi:hypothetical protein